MQIAAVPGPTTEAKVFQNQIFAVSNFQHLQWENRVQKKVVLSSNSSNHRKSIVDVVATVPFEVLYWRN